MHLMGWIFKVFPQMDEPPRQLDEPLIEGRTLGLPSSLQPKRLQHIVRLIVVPTIEMVKIGRIPHIPPTRVHPLP
jgi:hypothetical protein